MPGEGYCGPESKIKYNSHDATMECSAQAQSKRSRGVFEFGLNGRRESASVFLTFSDVEMAANLNLPGQPDSDSSSVTDQSLCSRSGNRSLRVAEKERRKNEAEDPFVLALTYFSEGRTKPRRTQAES